MDEPLSLDDVFGMLSVRRRRLILRLLDTDRREVDHGRLAERIAARGNGRPVSELSSQERKRDYSSIYQNHLPKLADVNAITYDKDRDLVSPGPNFDIFLDFLPAAELIFENLAYTLDTVSPTRVGGPLDGERRDSSKLPLE